MVHQATIRRAQLAVGVLEVGGESERGIHVGLDSFPVHFESDEAGACVGELAGDSVLLLLEQIDGDCSGEVCLKELAAFVFEAGDALALLVGLIDRGLVLAAERRHEFVGEPFERRGRELNRSVVASDCLLDVVYVEVRQVASGVRLAATTVEVVVGAASAVAAGEGEPGATAGAVDASLEVVRSLGHPLGGLVSAAEDGFDLGEGGEVRQWLVGSGVLGALPGHDPDVEGIGQEPVDVVHGQGLRRELGCRTGGKSLVFECLGQLVEAVVARCVGLEGPAHMMRPVGIEANRADLVAVADLTDVEVADWSLVRHATLLGLLGHALGDLGGEVAAVELGDRAHDPVQQQPRGCLVDVLADRDELGAGLGDREIDRHIVRSVAGETVDLVDDDVVDVSVSLQSSEHGLKCGAVGGASRLGLVYVLVDDLGIERVCLSPAGLTLGGDGESLGVAVGVHLAR